MSLTNKRLNELGVIAAHARTLHKDGIVGWYASVTVLRGAHQFTFSAGEERPFETADLAVEAALQQYVDKINAARRGIPF